MNEILSFLLVLLPLMVVLIGILYFKRSGAEMAIVGVLLAAALAMSAFHTCGAVVFGAVIYGILKSLGITLAVVLTMLMIFLMNEAGALDIISQGIKRVADTKEEQALFVGIAFGTFVTSLGVVTPALFPPLLVAMGFSAGTAVAISVLGYNASTSFALLSIPVTLPAAAFDLDLHELTYRITLFLPVVSTVIALAMLWVVGGKESIKKGLVPALLVGLSIGISAILLVLARFPIMLLGVAVGLIGMVVLYLYIHLERKMEGRTVKGEPMERNILLRALSPWLILIVIAAIISIPSVTEALKPLDGNGFSSSLTAYQNVDLNFFVQPYFPIMLALLFSYPLLKLPKEKAVGTIKLWSRRIWGPIAAFSLFFSLAYIMAFSAMEIQGGALVGSTSFPEYNMNYIAGTVLADAFGHGYVFVAASLGLFGAVVGGSETGSNMLFYGIQRQASDKIGLTDGQFLTVYGAHANAGGVASAITPSKITTSVATIGGDREIESETMSKMLPLVVLLTILIGVMTGIFVKLVT